MKRLFFIFGLLSFSSAPLLAFSQAETVTLSKAAQAKSTLTAVDEEHHLGYLGSSAGSLTVLDLQTLQEKAYLQNVVTAAGLDSNNSVKLFILSPDKHYLYLCVYDGFQSHIVKLEAATLRFISTSALTLDPELALVDPSTRRLYLMGNNQMEVLDPDSLQRTALVTVSGVDVFKAGYVDGPSMYLIAKTRLNPSTAQYSLIQLNLADGRQIARKDVNTDLTLVTLWFNDAHTELYAGMYGHSNRPAVQKFSLPDMKLSGAFELPYNNLGPIYHGVIDHSYGYFLFDNSVYKVRLVDMALAGRASLANSTSLESTNGAGFQDTILHRVFFSLNEVSMPAQTVFRLDLTDDAGAGVPPPPLRTTAEVGAGQTRVTWDAVPGAKGYTVKVELMSNPDGLPPKVVQVADSAPVVVSGLTAGRTYWVSVSARNSNGDGTASPVISIVPTVPSAGLLTIQRLEPLETEGEPAFTLYVHGSNFTSLSIVEWNSVSKPTRFIRENELAASITSADIRNAGSVAVRVLNAEKAPSEVVSYTIAGAPRIRALSPSDLSVSANAVLEAQADNVVSFSWTLKPKSVQGVPPSGAADGTIAASSTQRQLALADLHLAPGVYTVLVVGTNVAGKVSVPFEVDLNITTSDLGQARIRPNPWRADKHGNAKIIFDQLRANSTIKIFTLSGHWVKTLYAPQGQIDWDLRNDAGDPIASGIYFTLITNDQGEKAVLQLVVVR